MKSLIRKLIHLVKPIRLDKSLCDVTSLMLLSLLLLLLLLLVVVVVVVVCLLCLSISPVFYLTTIFLVVVGIP